MLDHRARDVGVQVEARDDRHARPDHLAHAREQLAFAVVEMLGDHRAVQVEVHAVDRPGLQRGVPACRRRCARRRRA